MALFSVTTSVSQLVDINLRVLLTLDERFLDTGTTDTVGEVLKGKIKSLSILAKRIRTTVLARDGEFPSHRAVHTEEQNVRAAMNKSITTCIDILTQFHVFLQTLPRPPTHTALLERNPLRSRNELRDPFIHRLLIFLESHLQLLGLSLASFEVFMSHRYPAEIVAQLRQLSAQVAQSRRTADELQEASSAICTMASDPSTLHIDLPEDQLRSIDINMIDEEQAMNGNLRGVIRQAVSIHHLFSNRVNSSNHSDGISETARGELARADPFVAAQYNRPPWPSSAGLSVSCLSLAPQDPNLVDPKPDFDDTTHLEPLEALIERHTQKAVDDFQRKRYSQAEKHQRQAIALLKERQAGHNVAFDRFEDYQHTLANILGCQKKHEQAEEIRHGLLRDGFAFRPTSHPNVQSFVDSYPDRVRGLKDAKQFHALARGKLDQFNINKDDGQSCEILLEVAERDAKRAFKLRLHFGSVSDPLFLETVDLLLKIYDAQNNTMYWNVYWKLYIGSSPEMASPSLTPTSPRASISRVNSASAAAPSRPSVALSDSPELTTWSTTSDTAPLDPLYSTYSCVAGTTDDTRIHLDPKAVKKDLRLAIRKGDLHTIADLLERSGQPDDLVSLVLLESTKKGEYPIVYHLVHNLDVRADLMSISKECALHLAAQHGHRDILQLLLDARANPNLAGSDGWTAIHFAIHGNHEHNLFTLLHHPRKADVDACNTYGDTGLHAAAEADNFRLADILIRAGAHTTLANKGGFTPLEIAVEKRNDKFVRAWLNAGLPSEVDWDKCASTSPFIQTVVRRHLAGLAAKTTSESGRALSESSPSSSPVRSPRSPTSFSFSEPTGRDRHSDSVSSVSSVTSAPSSKRRSFSKIFSRR